MEEPRKQKSFTSVPVIDFAGVDDPIRRKKICAQVTEACETLGFFEIANSCVPVEVLDDAFDINKQFFDQPMAEKLTMRDNNPNKEKLVPFQLGYKHFPVLRGLTNRMEEIVFRDYHLKPRDAPEDCYTNGYDGIVDRKKNWWPQRPAGYREKVERLKAALGKQGDILLDIFSESLGLPADHIRLHHHKNAEVPRYLNFHHYPKGEKPSEAEMGIGAHKDSSVFTIVAQTDGEKGLEINPDGEWISIMPQRGGLIVNVGDILQVLHSYLISLLQRFSKAAYLLRLQR
jgi:isopenicillin N synthase-like dioxygenase